MNLLPVVMLMLAAAQAPTRDGCTRDVNVPRCAEAQARAFERLYGTRPIEAHRDAGDQVRRVYYVDGSSEDVAAITFIWPRGGDPEAIVQFPPRPGEATPSSLRAPIPPDVWSDLIQGSANIDRVTLPRPDPPGSVSVCLHPWQFTVEASDPGVDEDDSPTIRRRTESCENGFAAAFGHEAQRAALPLFPVCAPLSLRQYRGIVHLLAMCARLQGDRTTAAEALTQATEMREIDRDSAVVDLRRLFASDVVIDWNGARATGAAAAIALWAARALEQSPTFFFAAGARGSDRDTVQVTGMLRRYIQPSQGAPFYERASVEQLWRRQLGRFVLVRATVGPWEPYRPPRP